MSIYVVFSDEAFGKNKIIVKFANDKSYDDFETRFRYFGGINNFFSEPASRNLKFVKEYFPSLRIINGANSKNFFDKLYRILYHEITYNKPY